MTNNKSDIVVVETSVLLDMLEGDESWTKFEKYLNDKLWVIPFATYTEIEFGFRWKIEDSELRREKARVWQRVLATCEIKYPDQEICNEAAKRGIEFRKRYKTASKKGTTDTLVDGSYRRHWSDIWIASCASILKIPIVTKDDKWENWFPDLDIYMGNGS